MNGSRAQLSGIDRLYAAVERGVRRRDLPFTKRLVDFDAFLVFRLRSVDDIRRAGSAGQAVAGRDHRRSENAIVGDVVERAYRLRRATTHQGHQPGKESEGLEVVVRV